jgi:predicted enzyme related to lactoylglutathione lyase
MVRDSLNNSLVSRDFRCHWTPFQLDLHLDNLDEPAKRALRAGGTLDREVQRGPKANLANLSDPSGNGIDLVEMPEEVARAAVAGGRGFEDQE